jgi:ferredoxin--NADP+ reductase
MRVAVVGAGPAGFYATGALLDSGLVLDVDLFDRLPTPWGLVRLGVAPDHPKIKSVSRVFETIAARPGFRFLGNVELGRDLDHEDLARHYDAVVYAVGAGADRLLGIPGETLPGSVSARAFVAWYNGHPDCAELAFDLSHERAVVVGNGNVALDVARMLALDVSELARTDIADHALDALAASAVKELVVLGRRGPAQASFTNPELRELGRLDGVDVVVRPDELGADEPEDANARRNLETLREWAVGAPARENRTIRLRFLASPVALLGEERVEGVEVARNTLKPRRGGGVAAVPTGERETIPCGLVLRSIGYRGTPLPGVPFDERTGTIPNDGGRVAPGVYCTGWIRRGPAGVIGTNRKDAAETVETLLADARSGALRPPPEPGAGAIDGLLAARGVEVVDESGWERIDAEERERGAATGRPRVKLARWDELLQTARHRLPATVAG